MLNFVCGPDEFYHSVEWGQITIQHRSASDEFLCEPGSYLLCDPLIQIVDQSVSFTTETNGDIID